MSGEERKEIYLSTDILTEIFHYCSRKDLALRVSRTNSHFWHSSKNLPTLHFVHDIEFWPNVVYIQYKENGSLHSGALIFEDIPIPQPFVRFRNVSIHSHLHSHFQHNQSLQNFFESSKHAFVGSKLNIKTIEQSEKVTTQTIEVLNNSLLDLYSIRIACGRVDISWWRRIGLDRFLPTKGVLNCNKLIIRNMALMSDMTVAFAKWLHWKQKRKNSRRHLIFEQCNLECDRAFIDLVSWLKEAFLTATSPVNYVISYVQCYIPISDMEFCLKNKETGERFTILKFSVDEYGTKTFQIWRRIPVEDDNQKNVDVEHLSILSGECAANDSFDKDFYDL